MPFDGFDWDGGNAEKCREHGVSQAEIEDLFLREILIIDDPHDLQVERRYRAIGLTAEGRALFVVFTLRNDRIRPLSASYMHRKEVDRYAKDNPRFQNGRGS